MSGMSLKSCWSSNHHCENEGTRLTSKSAGREWMTKGQQVANSIWSELRDRTNYFLINKQIKENVFSLVELKPRASDREFKQLIYTFCCY